MADGVPVEHTFAYAYSADGTAQALLIEDDGQDERLGSDALAGPAPARAAPASAGAAFRERFRYNPAVFNVLLVADPALDGSKVPVASADLARWSPWFAGVLDVRRVGKSLLACWGPAWPHAAGSVPQMAC